MFELPSNFVSSVNTNATGAIGALSPITTLIVGVLLGALVLTIIIRSISGHK